MKVTKYIFGITLLVFSTVCQGLVIFDNTTEFYSSNNISSVTDFNGYPSQDPNYTLEVEYDGVYYTSESCSTSLHCSPSNVQFWNVTNHFFSPYLHVLGSNQIVNDTISFGDDSYVNSFGLDFIAIGNDDWNIIISELDNSTTTLHLDMSMVEPVYNSYFMGFYSDIGISSVLFSPDSSDGGAGNWVYDNVARSDIKSVPEPGSFVLLLSGLLILVVNNKIFL